MISRMSTSRYINFEYTKLPSFCLPAKECLYFCIYEDQYLLTEKNQVAGLELCHMFVLCGNSVLRIHIPNIAVSAHQESRWEVASGKRPEKTVDTTRL